MVPLAAKGIPQRCRRKRKGHQPRSRCRLLASLSRALSVLVCRLAKSTATQRTTILTTCLGGRAATLKSVVGPILATHRTPTRKILTTRLACDLTRRGRLRSSACLPMLGSVRLRGHADANLPPGAARPVPGRTARLLHPPRRCAVRARRRVVVRPGGPVAAAPEPGAGLSARLGQRLRRLGPRPHRRRAAARPAGRLAAGRRPAGVRGRCHDLAALRRRMLAKPWLLLPSLAPLGRPADRRRLGVSVDRAAGLDRDSWTAPVDARRLHPLDDTDQTAAGQIRALVGRLDT